MLISGVWHACDDGVLRPVITAEVQTQHGTWIKAPFLVDIDLRKMFRAPLGSHRA